LLKIYNLVTVSILVITFVMCYISSQNMIVFSGLPIIYSLWFLIFIIQIIVFIPSFIFKTEHYYDLTGGITFISTIIISYLVKIQLDQYDITSLLLVLFISVWALRLSSFLFFRVKRSGEDVRFIKIKQSFSQFLMTFTIQGLWVFMCLFPAIIVMSSNQNNFNSFTIVGSILWVVGFLIEIISDYQKAQFNKVNKGSFISSGLWSRSRHPNYFGEFLLWLGITIISFPYFEGYQYTALISPLFVYLLLNKVSGVNLLENIAEKRWGDNKKYIEYKNRTPVFFPKIF
jgi:steroid 5-alpha reductase family enzyme